MNPTSPQSEGLYRNRFAQHQACELSAVQYMHLFYDAWKKTRFHPVEGAHWLGNLLRQTRQQARRRKAESNELMIPPVMIFSITEQCNLKCKACYAAKGMDRETEELSLERIRKLFYEASELGVGVIMIAGGEPLMRPEILWAASEHRNVIFPVFTNGLMLNEGSLAYFKHNRNLVPILSIEGNRQFTDQRRGKGVYSQLISTMEKLQQSRRLFGISITLTRENFNELSHPDWLQQQHKLGSRLFFLVEYMPQSEADMELCLTEAQKKLLPATLEKLRKHLPALFVSLPGDEAQYGECLAAGRGFVHVSAVGSLEPCPFAPYSDINIRNISLKQALHSRFLNRIRESHHLLGEAKGECRLWENGSWVEQLLAPEIAH